MNAIHDQLDAEGVVREEQATVIKGRVNLPGRLCLTPKRLVFLKAHPALLALGAVGGALASKRPMNVEIEIPVTEITGVAKETAGLARNVLAVSHEDGETARFAVKRFDDWDEALQPLLDAAAAGAIRP